MWEVSTITDAGSNLLASWITGTELRITRAFGGTGTVEAEELYALTALSDPKQPMSLVGMTKNENDVTIKLQLEAATDAYTLQQIGVFARVGNGEEALLAVFQDNVGISIPAASTSQSFIYNFFATIAVNNTGTLTIEIDGGAAVTMETVQGLLDDKQDKITATGLLYRDEDGTIREGIPGEDFDAGKGGGGFYGESDSAADNSAKIAAAEGYESLEIGDLAVVVFDNANTAASPTLQVGDTEAKKIVSRGKTYLLAEDYWEAGDYCIFLYDGTNWVLLFRFGTYIPMKQKGAAGGVATLAEDGKVVASQLRGGFVISATQPSDTTLLWIDTKQVMRYYDASSKTWKPVLPVWG